MGDITWRDGWMGAAVTGTVSLRHPFIPGADVYLVPDCIVVTGDLDTARRRLAEPTDAAIERAARTLHQVIATRGAPTWDELEPDGRQTFRAWAWAALAAAEETPDA